MQQTLFIATKQYKMVHCFNTKNDSRNVVELKKKISYKISKPYGHIKRYIGCLCERVCGWNQNESNQFIRINESYI